MIQNEKAEPHSFICFLFIADETKRENDGYNGWHSWMMLNNSHAMNRNLEKEKGGKYSFCRLRKKLCRIILMKEKFLFSGHHQPLASHDRLSLLLKNN